MNSLAAAYSQAFIISDSFAVVSAYAMLFSQCHQIKLYPDLPMKFFLLKI